MRRCPAVVLIALGLGGSLCAPAWAADTYAAAPNTIDAAPTPCTETTAGQFACANLRSATAAAQADSGSTVRLAAGTYTLSIGHLVINASGNSFTIAGAGQTQTTIEQTAAERVLNLSAGTLKISGVTLTGGRQTVASGCPRTGEVGGGAVLNLGTLTLDQVNVTGNTATGAAGASASSGTAHPGQDATGGGVCSRGTLAVTDSTFTGNAVTGGKGGSASASASAGVGGGGFGGAIASSGPLTITGSTFTANSAAGGDGGPATGTGGGGGGQNSAGGAIYEVAVGTPPAISVSGSEIASNTSRAGDGGSAQNASGGSGGNSGGSGVYIDTGTNALISQTTVSGGSSIAGDGGGGNGGGSAGGGGGSGVGAVENGSSALQISRSTISANSAVGGAGGNGTGGAVNGDDGGAGAGAILSDAAVTVTGSTLADNKAQGIGKATSPQQGSASGGAMQVDSGGTIVNSTITRNTAMGPANAPGRGGAIYVLSSVNPLTLASDTIAGNTSLNSTGTLGQGGNLYMVPGAEVTAADTIIAGGISDDPNSRNCSQPTGTDGGHNLESTNECGFSSTKADLVDADPLLGPLASNGGPAQTMAPGADSPALNAGGQCTDPTNGNAPLSTDQRGAPRSYPCDIGAYQHQVPTETAAAKISGLPRVGRTVTCSSGAFSGDQPLELTYAWLRDGKAIAHATNQTYRLAIADAGRHDSCRIIASNAYGSATAASAAVKIQPPVPSITKLRQSHKRWRAGSRRAHLSRRGTPIGTTFTFTLNAPAKLTLTFTRRHHRHAAGTLTFARGHTGKNRISFSGRLSRHHKLAPGTYTMRITATDSSGHGTSHPLTFTIV